MRFQGLKWCHVRYVCNVVSPCVALRRALSGNLRFKGVGEAEVEFGEPWPPHVQDI